MVTSGSPARFSVCKLRKKKQRLGSLRDFRENALDLHKFAFSSFGKIKCVSSRDRLQGTNNKYACANGSLKLTIRTSSQVAPGIERHTNMASLWFAFQTSKNEHQVKSASHGLLVTLDLRPGQSTIGSQSLRFGSGSPLGSLS